MLPEDIRDRDRWAEAARQLQHPRQEFRRPLEVLAYWRMERLAAGHEAYTPPLNIAIDTDYTVGWPAQLEPEGLLLTTHRNFAAAGVPITRDEAHLAGAFGRLGVMENLDMSVTIALEAGAAPVWVERHIEEPALRLITAIFGRGPGKPAGTDQGGRDKYKARRLRLAARARRGEPLLRRYLGEDWRRVVFDGAAPLTGEELRRAYGEKE